MSFDKQSLVTGEKSVSGIQDLMLWIEETEEELDEFVVEIIASSEAKVPELIKVVSCALVNYKINASERTDFILALYILSYLKESSVFDLIIEFALLPADWISKVLGAYLTESMTRWLVSTYDGNLTAIKSVIENETACLFARSATLRSLAGLVAVDKLSREDVITYLKELMHSDLIKDYEFAALVVSVATNLYPEELYREISDLFEKDMVDETYITQDFVEETLEMSKERCLQEYIYSRICNLPITDIKRDFALLKLFKSRA